ncbi:MULTISPECIES: flagellar hook assembly protein FlgD [Bacillus]|uniref:flagellar hook assembly protein FlgD n=1 Tax=Bacillus TaxID=1386 RepID=UPI00042A7A2F|nr:MULTISPECIES: flagellar hook assembly protein FlgD [Bacillus]QHZ46805.1 flagellar hook assembly protein FlgD [Bacillus sp. NSP9.1]WFA06939.1 flagellar hook assembly protein FlgD [Bacillus sp. HSf4]
MSETAVDARTQVSSTIANSTSSSSKKTTESSIGTSLDKDAFLQLLVTQLQNQDPTNPMDDREFISQMATFSSLEQLTNLNSTMSTFVGLQDPMSMYVGWIGKEVTFEGDSHEEKTALVQSVKSSDGQYVLVLDDGTEVSPWNVTAVGSSDK